MVVVKFDGERSAGWRQGVIGAVIAVVLGLGFLMLAPLGQGLRALSYDIPLVLRTKIPVQDASIVSIDEESYLETHQNPTNLWDRSLHIELLQRLLAQGAKAVVFDILFDTPWPDPQVDERFAEAIARATNRVVLVDYLDVKKGGGTVSRTLVTNTAPIHGAAPSGVVQLPRDFGLTVREHFSDKIYTSLAWKTAEVLGKVAGDPAERRWLNYYGDRGAVPAKSYHQVLKGTNALPPDFFAGKVVFVGRNPALTSQGTDNTDEYRTPYTRWSNQTSTGVEIQATAFLNLWRNEWLTELSPATECLLMAVLGALFGCVLTVLRPWPAVVGAIVGCLAVAVLSVLLVWQWRLWFPWMIVCVVQVPIALGWSIFARTTTLMRRQKELETQLAEAVAATPVSDAARPHGAMAGPAQQAPVISDHTLLRCVGRGAYGEVWLARDVLGNFRAAKIVLRKTFASDQPFEREFHGLQKFSPISRSHPGWVDILHVGRNDEAGYFFYIMEAGDDEASGQKIDPTRYVPKTLARELQRRGKLPLPECLTLGLALAEALEHLHGHSLVHRDIKPSNIIFVKGAPRFTDLGLITEINPRGGEVSRVGTQGYIPPEGPGTAAADVFSLGKVLYEAGMGLDRLEFPALPNTLLEATGQPEWDQFIEILLKACDPDARKRYQSAADLQADLLRLQSTLKG
jgi:CHASE2 domain-containing sensor protein